MSIQDTAPDIRVKGTPQQVTRTENLDEARNRAEGDRQVNELRGEIKYDRGYIQSVLQELVDILNDLGVQWEPPEYIPDPNSGSGITE